MSLYLIVKNCLQASFPGIFIVYSIYVYKTHVYVDEWKLRLGEETIRFCWDKHLSSQVQLFIYFSVEAFKTPCEHRTEMLSTHFNKKTILIDLHKLCAYALRAY